MSRGEVLVVPAKKIVGEFAGRSTMVYAEELRRVLAVAREDAVWLDRDAAEGDENFLQLIPYIVLRRPPGEVFVYERSQKGGESRLYNKVSVGLGGHVERSDAVGVDHNAALALDAATRRELAEEVGLGQFDDEALHLAGLVHDRGDAVGRVHLGLVCVLYLPWAGLTVRPREASIARHRWSLPGDLLEAVDADRLEGWSRLVLERIPLA
jgi:predicted NUDIX family phosphoesterase